MAGRVNIFGVVTHLVVVPVPSRPPENAFLNCNLGSEGQNKLKPARGLKASMREIPMIASGDKEHAARVNQTGHSQTAPRPTDAPEESNRRHMAEPEQDCGSVGVLR